LDSHFKTRVTVDKNYGKDEKKIVFCDTEKRHAELKIRLHYDGLTQLDFFKAVLAGYIESDELFMPYLDKIKESHSKHGKIRKQASKKIYEKSVENKNKFALSDEEIENIFDILEEEHADI
jgi:hypothetical protein